MKPLTVFDIRQLKDVHLLLAVLIGPVVWSLLWFVTPGASGAITLMLVVNMVLLYPLLEELAFRGFLQGWLLENETFRRRVSGLTLANLLTSIVFAAAHLINQPPLWAAGVFFPSLVFGYFRDRHQSIVASFLLHAWYNAGFLLVMVR